MLPLSLPTTSFIHPTPPLTKNYIGRAYHPHSSSSSSSHSHVRSHSHLHRPPISSQSKHSEDEEENEDETELDRFSHQDKKIKNGLPLFSSQVKETNEVAHHHNHNNNEVEEDEDLEEEDEEEEERTLQEEARKLRKAFLRKTVDYYTELILHAELRQQWYPYTRHSPWPAIQPDLPFLINLLPPSACLNQPVQACTTKFVHTSLNKFKSYVNALRVCVAV
ncbi:WD repeat-containing protein 33 [Coelomomyces lativittatus]|nr:WD repeat-containing protein 33 [Coelomomyces lativittatus]